MSDDNLTPQQKLEKRVRGHSQTIGVWLASTQARLDGETDRAFAERMLTLGAWHAMKPVNAPLLRAVVDGSACVEASDVSAKDTAKEHSGVAP
jgi:hypothetical protein